MVSSGLRKPGNGPLLRKIRENLEKSGNFSERNDKPGKVGNFVFLGDISSIFLFLQTSSEILNINC